MSKGRPMAVLLLILFFSSTLAVFSQSDKPKILFKKVEGALSNDEVSSIYQDSYGYLWVGTFLGLHKYDGEQYQLFHQSDDENGLPFPLVEKMLETSTGEFWIGSPRGLSLYNRDKNRFTTIALVRPDSASNNHTISGMVEDYQGRLWIGSQYNGIFYKDPNAEKFNYYPTGLPPGFLLSTMMVENDSIMWVGSINKGLVRLNIENGTSDHFQNDPSDAKSIGITNVSDLTLDVNGDLYISGAFSGIDVLSPGSRTFRHLKINNPHVHELHLDQRNRLWGTTENGGILLLDRNSGEFWNYQNDKMDPYSPPGASYWRIFEDKNHRLWFGSAIDGLTLVDDYLFKFFHLNEQQGLSNTLIRYVHEDSEERLWLATDGGGLNVFDKERRLLKQFRHDPENPNSIGADAVMCVFEYDQENFWIGTWNGGISNLNFRTGTFTHLFPGNFDLGRVYQIMRASNGHIWVGAYQTGTSRYDPVNQKLETFKFNPEDSNSLSHDVVTTIMEDSDGNLWFGSQGAGVSVLKKEDVAMGKFTRYAHDENDPNSLPGPEIHHIIEDSRQRIWLATKTGISLFNKESGTFTNYGVEDGLINRYTYALAEDENGYIWISTLNGVSKFDPNSQSFTNYHGGQDGLQDGRFSRFAVVKTKRGEIGFGGSGGLNLFYPDSLRNNPYPPEVYVTGLKIFNKDVVIDDEHGVLDKDISLLKELRLNYKQSVFTLSYIGINFTNSINNKYAYRLEGFEEDWNYVGDIKTATYTNLDPGTYQFQVKASNNDDVWNETGRSLTIIIDPPWWETIYFRLAMILLAIAAIFGFIRYRTYRLLNERKRLEKVVEERTHEIKVLNQDLVISEKMASLGVLTRGLAHEINNPINFISGASDKLFDLIAKLKPNSKNEDSDYNGKLQKLQSIIKEGIERTNIIVKSLSNYAKDDTEHFELYDVIKCLEDALILLSNKINNSEVTIIKELPESALIYCLPGRISQVFVNLISNAIDSIDGVGEIHISIQPNEYSEIVIEIRDTGKGISDDDITRLFEPFYSTRDVGEGKGLGLYLVYGIINQHTGQIHAIKNDPGTTFQVVLPVQQLQYQN